MSEELYNVGDTVKLNMSRDLARDKGLEVLMGDEFLIVEVFEGESEMKTLGYDYKIEQKKRYQRQITWPVHHDEVIKIQDKPRADWKAKP